MAVSSLLAKEVRKPNGQEENDSLQQLPKSPVNQGGSKGKALSIAIMLTEGSEYCIDRRGRDNIALWCNSNMVYNDEPIQFTHEEWARFLEHGKRFLED